MATLNSTVSTSRRKIALIIGNQNYSRPENRLRHSINDADDLSAVLRNIKFHVKKEHDLTNSQMVSAISSFSKTIVDGDLVLFYFSGHGYQINGRNYLMHVDDDLIETDEDVENYAISVERSLNQLTQKNSSFATVFILDCCRLHHPKTKKNTKGFLARPESTGLHAMEAPVGTYIAFACSPNQTASDGEITDRNGLLAKHLLKHIAKPNKDITQLFRTVANGVCIESKQKQRPMRMDGLMRSGHIYLNEKLVTVDNAESTSPSRRSEITRSTTAIPAVTTTTTTSTTSISDRRTQRKTGKKSTDQQT